MIDDDFLTPTEGSTAWVAELRRRCPTPEETDALCDMAERLASIESQVLWRTEGMPKGARCWTKSPSGQFIRFRDKWGDAISNAPDYRPDEPGPLFLPILDPPE